MKQISFASVLVFALFSTASAQDSATVQRSSLTITAAASHERVRITAPSSVVQMHVEIYAAGGEKLFDQEIRGGNVFDWYLQDGQADRLAPGVYVCVVTAKSISGRLTQRLGTVTVAEKSASVQPAESLKLSVQQTQAIGPMEENASWTVPGSDESQTTTVIAHDGTDGQMIRGRGALTFRLGDFFSGKDQEQMRLTEAGNLGIGTSEPKAKLDVAGAIRTQQGLIFSNGSTLNVSDKGALTLTSDSGTITPNISGSGTANRITRWLDNSGTVGDTQVSETNGSVVVGNPTFTGNLQIFGPATGDDFAGMGPDLTNGPSFNFGYSGSSFGRASGFFNVRPDASAVAPNPSLRFMTANVQRMIIDNLGKVGIGTTGPLVKLDVRGDVFVGLPSVPAGVSSTLNALYVANDSGDSNNHFRIDGFANNLAIVAHSGPGSAAGASISLRTGLTAGGDTDRVTIDPSGKVSIGATSSPAGQLYVESTAGAIQSKSTGTSGGAALFQITNASNPADGLFVSTLGTGPAIVGTAFGNGDAVLATAAGTGFAGNFNGDINVTGTIFAGTKDFKIDHPLDPANKYLVHTSIESSEVKNLYDGVVVLDPSGEAMVVLPDWFEALNRDFRYQLTCIGGSAQVYVAEEIANHRFKIAGGRPGMKVSWQVTGNRQDPFIKAHPMRVEEAKPAIERGFFIHPELYGKPEEMGIQWARRQEQMRQTKEQGEKLSLPKQ
jgi:hypothetical protein